MVKTRWERREERRRKSQAFQPDNRKSVRLHAELQERRRVATLRGARPRRAPAG